MRDGRDYVIATLAAMLLFCVGLLLGQEVRVLPEASAQGTSVPGGVKDNPATGPQPPAPPVPPPLNPRPGLEGRTSANRTTDSDSNNRFVAVTCPTVTGESVLFLVDSVQEQVAVYRFQAGQGLEYLASRKIEYDLKVSGYKDISEFSYEQMRQLYQQEVSRQAAKAAAANK